LALNVLLQYFERVYRVNVISSCTKLLVFEIYLARLSRYFKNV
jgi:hypothetical protein